MPFSIQLLCGGIEYIMQEIEKSAYIKAQDWCIEHNLPFNIITTYANGKVQIHLSVNFN